MHPNRRFLAHFVVHMPSCLHACFMSCILCIVIGVCEGTIIWGMLFWGFP